MDRLGYSRAGVTAVIRHPSRLVVPGGDGIPGASGGLLARCARGCREGADKVACSVASLTALRTEARRDGSGNAALLSGRGATALSPRSPEGRYLRTVIVTKTEHCRPAASCMNARRRVVKRAAWPTRRVPEAQAPATATRAARALGSGSFRQPSQVWSTTARTETSIPEAETSCRPPDPPWLNPPRAPHARPRPGAPPQRCGTGSLPAPALQASFGPCQITSHGSF